MKTLSTILDEVFPDSSLSEEQKVLTLLLKESSVEEDALIGTMLLLKDNQKLMDEMILYIWYENPSPKQINDRLITMVQRESATA